MALQTLIVAILIIALLFWLIRLIPDALLQKISYVLLVVIAVLWVIRNLNAILHCCRV